MQETREGPITVVVVDDSPMVRQLVVEILQDAGMQVVGVGANGEEAVQLVQRLRPDVLTLDIRMPKMDGLEATRQIMSQVPTPIVIVAGTLAQADADIAFEALRSGALTMVRTPGLADREGCAKLVQTVRLMADVPVVHHWLPRRPAQSDSASAAVVLRVADCPHRVQMVGMVASTGGPAMLATVLAQLPADFPLPILVVQHITRGFVGGMAEWLGAQVKLRVGIANHGDTPAPGTVLLAPDDYHLQVNVGGSTELTKEPPYKGLRPAGNYLFRSLALAYGPRAVGIVLTGMGDDGADGLRALRRAGGLTLAQGESSCVVYGMPHEAVVHKSVEHVLSPDEIARTLLNLATMSPQSEREAHD